MAGRLKPVLAIAVLLILLPLLLRPDAPASASPAADEGQWPEEDPPAPSFQVASCAQVFPDEPDIATWESELSPLAVCLDALPAAKLPVPFSHTTCGYVEVPSRHADPRGPTIRLAVLILPAAGTSPRSDPLFWAQGGPGGSTVTDLKWLAHDSPLRYDRDMVLFDQRGTGHSIPALDCPEWEEAMASAAENDITPAEADEIEMFGVSACRRRLQAAGAELSDFNTLENAADVDDVRVALGYDRINLYGVSYGTELALNVMRSYSDSLRSVILDSVVPPQANVETDAYRSFDHALSEFFDTCRADPACRTAYPDLEQTYLNLAARLEANPVAMRVVDIKEQRGFEIDLTADRLNSLLFGTFYGAEYNIPLLPALIEDLNAGARELASGVVWEGEDYFYEGMYLSATCSDGYDIDTSALQYSDIRSTLAQTGSHDARWMDRVCEEWGVGDLGGALDEPVASKVPTLLVSGRYDPITPTHYAEMVAETLPNSLLVEFPNVGHGVVASSECADRIFSEFLASPTTYLDTTCVADIPGFDFDVTQDVTPVSWAGLLLDYFEGRIVGRAAVILGAAALAMVVVVAPLWIAWGSARESLRARRLARKILKRWRRAAGVSGSWWARHVREFAVLTVLALLGVLVALGDAYSETYYPLAVSDTLWLKLALPVYAILTVCLVVAAWFGARSSVWTRRRKVMALMVSVSAAFLLVLLLSGFLRVFVP